MVSELVAAESVRLAATAATFLSGIVAAIGIRAILRRGDGGGKARSIAAMFAASGALATGAGVFIATARLGYIPGMLVLYAAIGFVAGLLAGLFPRAAGIPLMLTAIVSSMLVAAGLGSWLEWRDGAEAARLTAYSSSASGTLCSLRSAFGHGLSEERNLELSDGPVELEFDVVDISGPFSVAFGDRRYRLVAVAAGGTRIVLPGDRGPLLNSADGGILAGILGCSVTTLHPQLFEPFTLATASYVLRPDGSIELVTQ